MSFPIEKKLDLSYLGESWQGAYLSLSALSFAESRAFSEVSADTDNPASEGNALAADKIFGVVQNHLLSGKAWDGKELVDVTKDNLSDMPIEVIVKAIETLSGTPDPNS